MLKLLEEGEGGAGGGREEGEMRGKQSVLVHYALYVTYV